MTQNKGSPGKIQYLTLKILLLAVSYSACVHMHKVRACIVAWIYRPTYHPAKFDLYHWKEKYRSDSVLTRSAGPTHRVMMRYDSMSCGGSDIAVHGVDVHLLEMMYRVFGQFTALGVNYEAALVVALRL